MGFLTNSVAKKITIMIALSIAAVSFLVFISFSFFGKISQVSTITNAAFEYEVLCGNAKYDFEKFVVTGDKNFFDTFDQTMSVIRHRDGTIGDMYRVVEKGLSVKDAVIEFQKTHETRPGQDAVAGLMKTLMGNPLVVQLVEMTDITHSLTTEWQKLGNEYVKTQDKEKKQEIVRKITEIVVVMPKRLVDFHAVMADIANHLSGTIKKVFLTIGFTAIVLIIVMAFFITRSITKPLKQTVNHVSEISQGNFLNALDIKNRDELGIMVRAMNTMSLNLREMVKKIKEDIETLNNSSTDLSSLSDHVSSGASNNKEKSNVVAAAAEQMSSNMDSVSSAMENSSENTNSVVTAVEEMTATINEIAQNTETAKNIADNAVSKSESAATQMTRLEEMASAIGHVTETIREISEQTDLLSLNATIEAARAGDAGKGFAVVASEIKELSKQTSAATLDIQTQIDEIQNTVSSSVVVIKEISNIALEVNQIVHSIASAIEEQSIATKDISQNASHVFEGITDVNEKVSQSSSVSREITESIQQVSNSSDEMNSNSEQMKKSAFELSKLAEALGKRIDQFTV
ncbi:MAG: methyl-accepting chemotaxis protein [Desulfobacteraceae bacterium]|nr:methyl-accepting chemotaxis protein [Desulfobacteraceae bacterium]